MSIRFSPALWFAKEPYAGMAVLSSQGAERMLLSTALRTCLRPPWLRIANDNGSLAYSIVIEISIVPSYAWR